MKAILINGYPKYQKYIKDSQTKELFGRHIDGLKYADDATLVELGFKDVIEPTKTVDQKFGEWHETETEITRYVINKTPEDIVIEFESSKIQAIARFESDTDELIRSVVGERSNEYELAEQEAIAFKAGGYVDVDVTPSISSDAIANGRTNIEACDLILSMATNWRAAQVALRTNRLLAKANAKNATTQAELDNVERTWNTFKNHIKIQIIVVEMTNQIPL